MSDQETPAIVPAAWMPPCRMERIVTHWTGGGYEATRLDLDHYHVLVEGSLHLERGRRTIADNVSTSDNVYAAHTKGLNTGSIGIAVCAMAEAVERPFDPGWAPMTEAQWLRLAQVAAELCRRYSIPVTARTVLSHAEVQATLGKPQAGKWDIAVLPWAPDVPRQAVFDSFRAEVSRRLAQAGAMV